MDIEIQTTSIPLEVGVEKAGPQGLSAYQVAQKDGFVGTEQEWLASLKGEKGDKGETGPIGPAGPQGERGLTGETGPKGDKGDVGETGATGQPGRDGTNGIDGISPTVSTSKSGTTTTIEITDKNGTHTATINDGINGTNGRDGYVQYTAGDNITIENNVISATGGDLSNYYTKSDVNNLFDTNRLVITDTRTDAIFRTPNNTYSCTSSCKTTISKNINKDILLILKDADGCAIIPTKFKYQSSASFNADAILVNQKSINYIPVSISVTWNSSNNSYSVVNITNREQKIYSYASTDYVDSAIASAITDALGGNY